MRETIEPESGSALEELTKDPSSRKRFLGMVGGAGAAGALAMFMAACGDDDDDKKSASTSEKKEKGGGGVDLEIVNYALTLEYLEAAFYADVIKSGVVKTKAVVEAAKMIGQNEQEHVDALLATAMKLGTPAEKPKTDFQAVIDGGEKMVLETAAVVENLGASAYLGQAGRIESKEILAAALAIHTIEGRHAAALNTIVGKPIVPDGAFAKPASMEEVLPKIKPFLVS
ncbi:MAG: ferritin-like domain-containing protein [Thermoleophilaceae bacterium]|nr:ferritin-like domain-containing protein [Thermoleophilaceae bacterium]